MRVFDTYHFMLKDIVAFKETGPYIENMLSALGLSFKRVNFDLCDISEGAVQKVISKYPALEKYRYTDDPGGITHYGITSNKRGLPDDGIYADEADIPVLLEVVSKIPRPFGLTSGEVVLDGISFFPTADNAPAINYKAALSDEHYCASYQYCSSRIERSLSGGGYKLGSVAVCIEVTHDPEPYDSGEILEKLRPYFGEPYRSPFVNPRACVFLKEETQRLSALEKEHRRFLEELASSSLPKPEPRAPRPWGIYFPPEKIPHVADKATNNKAFKGTGFERVSGTPNWLHRYACTDSRGLKYEADVQKLSYSNAFRFSLEVSGYNFKINYCHPDINVTKEGESLGILKEIAAFCVRVRDMYGPRLGAAFGETPLWYYI